MRINLRGGTKLWAAASLAVGLTLASTAAVAGQYAAIVLDNRTGRVLSAHDPDEQLHPASLTKMMTLYMAFEAVQAGRLGWSQMLPVSAHAASMSPTKLGLLPGRSISTEDAALGLMTKSANDAAVVLAEAMGGTEENFGRLMTRKARQLGMSRSNFENASGLPNDDQITTARDMATLGRALIRDFPKQYQLFSTKVFTYQGRAHNNHNRLLWNYEGADGIKTGFIRASGFNLVASAKRGDDRVIGVVLGGPSPGWRDSRMVQLLDAGFAKLRDGKGRDDDEPAVAQVKSAPVVSRGDTVSRPQTVAYRPAPAPVAPSAAPSRGADDAAAGWAIQLGAFAQANKARSVAVDALDDSAALRGGKAQVSPLAGRQGSVYRARIGGLTAAKARDACRDLARLKKSCVTLAPGQAT